MFKTTLKEIMESTVLKKIVFMNIYYQWDYEKTLQELYDDETIKLFNKLISIKQIYNAIQEGLEIYNEQGYY